MGVPAILALAGTAMSAVGAEKEGEAAKSAAQANARLSAMDAANESYRIARTASMVRSANITRIAKSGVTESGSALDVLAANEAEAKLQMDAIARSQRAYANIMYKQGQAAVEASRWAIAGNVLRGVGSMAGGSGYNFNGATGGWGPSGSGIGMGLSQPNFNWFPSLRRGGV